jgi:hypothetical protein
MRISSHSLHPSVQDLTQDKERVLDMVQEAAVARRAAIAAGPRLAAAPAMVTIPLTTVSASQMFDAYIEIQFPGDLNPDTTHLLVDSGNSMLIVPEWERIAGIAGYTVLGDAQEPWGSPAKVVKGPIQIATANGGVHTLTDCVFYACTGAPRTANFGVGCLVPWSASAWNTPARAGEPMRAPLAYNGDFPFAEFEYVPAANIFVANAGLSANGQSCVTLYGAEPPGYRFFQTIRGAEWMSLIPAGLEIGNMVTAWPGDVPGPIAMIDTGGGPVYLSDPNGYLASLPLQSAVMCPTWSSGSMDCRCVSDSLTLTLKDATTASTYCYRINTSTMPASVQGLTLVMCRVNQYMQGQQGMNIGGISALFNRICVDYASGRVGLKPR